MPLGKGAGLLTPVVPYLSETPRQSPGWCLCIQLLIEVEGLSDRVVLDIGQQGGQPWA
jgi:hypothetical protein